MMPDFASNIVLTGFMGTGKSAVGVILSDKLGLPLVDADAVLEKEAGRTIAQIFSEEGEERVRDLEKEVIQRCLTECGGNQVKASAILGITRATLRKRIDNLGIRF